VHGVLGGVRGAGGTNIPSKGEASVAAVPSVCQCMLPGCDAGAGEEDAMKGRLVVAAALGCLMMEMPGSSARAQVEAQDAPAVKSACGPMDVNFSVKETNTQATPSMQAGKALVYVFEDVTNVPLTPAMNFRVGLNGSWVGALKNMTYLSFAVDPGVQHLCTSLQGHAFFELEKGITLRQLHTETGKTYYLRLRHVMGKDVMPLVLLEPMDEDEGSLLLQTMRQAVWQKK